MAHSDNPLRGIEDIVFDGKGLNIALVVARWNPEINNRLMEGARSVLEAAGAKVSIERVAGAYELPLACASMMPHFDGCIAIGCLIKGETQHFEYIADAVTHGIMKINLESKKPLIYGVLTVFNTDQAQARCGMSEPRYNAGEEWARTCLESVLLVKKYAKVP